MKMRSLNSGKIMEKKSVCLFWASGVFKKDVVLIDFLPVTRLLNSSKTLHVIIMFCCKWNGC